MFAAALTHGDFLGNQGEAAPMQSTCLTILILGLTISLPIWQGHAMGVNKPAEKWETLAPCQLLR